MSREDEQVLTEKGLTFNSDLAIRDITISPNDHQEGDRKDRLMAVVINPEKEKIDLGYPEEAQDRLRSLRWRNTGESAIKIMSSFGTMIAGAILILDSFAEDPIKGVLGAMATGIGSYCFIKSQESRSIREDVLSGVKRLISEKIKTSTDWTRINQPAIE